MDEFQSQHNISVEKPLQGYDIVYTEEKEEAGFGKEELQYTGRFLSGEEFNSTSQQKMVFKSFI